MQRSGIFWGHGDLLAFLIVALTLGLAYAISAIHCGYRLSGEVSQVRVEMTITYYIVRIVPIIALPANEMIV